MSARVAERLARLGLELPPPPVPQGQYLAAVRHGDVVQVAGQVSRLGDGRVVRGPVTARTPSADLDAAARACVVRSLAALAAELDGDLDRVTRVLYVRGFVYAAADFEGYSAVLDRVSELLVAVFGDRGRHARSAVGVAGLPAGGLLEIELSAAVA